MNTTEGRTLGPMVAIGFLVLGGCGGSGSDQGQNSIDTGVLNLSVSDAPINAAKVCIKFDGIEFKKDGEDAPFDIDFEDPVVINLLANQGALSETLVSAEVDAGTYEWIRLKVDAVLGNGAGVGDTDTSDPACIDQENGSYLLTDVGELFNIRIPSGEQTGLKLIKDIVVPVNGTGSYTAEWDVGRSFIAPPGQGAGEAMMKPVVKLVANNEVGTLNGTVADALVIPNPADPAVCDLVDGFGPSIWVFDDNGVADDPIDGGDGSIEPIGTGIVGQDMQGDPYTYEIGFLLMGDYEIAYTCNGENFVPETGKPVSITPGAVVTVDFAAEDALPAD